MSRTTRPAGDKPAASGPVPPGAVRVWRGYRLDSLSRKDFLGHLGQTFIPVTAQLQRLYGLTAYLPAILPAEKPVATLPDEIALVFYESRAAYRRTAGLVAGRAYSLLHSAVFTPASRSEFPSLLGTSLRFDRPCHLFTEPADWRVGATRLLAGARRAGDDEAAFRSRIFAALDRLRTSRPPGLDGAICHAARDWVLVWEHWLEKPATAPDGGIRALAKGVDVILSKWSKDQPISTSLTTRYRGIRAGDSSFFNIIF